MRINITKVGTFFHNTLKNCLSDPGTRWSLFIFFIVFIAVSVFSYLTVWLGDDLAYQFTFMNPGYYGTACTYIDTTRRVATIPDVVSSQAAHYFSVNGRLTVHFLIQCFAGIWGQCAFSLCNGAMYIVLIVLLLKLAGASWKSQRSVLTVSTLLLLFFTTFMTPVCQISYMWGYALMLGAVICFLSTKPRPAWQCILMAILAFLAGMSQESLGIGIAVAMIVYWARNIRKMSVAQWCVMVAFGAGLLLLCLSPAARNRAGSTHVGIVNSLMYIISAPRLLFVFVVAVFAMLFRSGFKLGEYCRANLFFMVALVALIFFVVCVGVDNKQMLLGIELCALVLLMRLLPHHQLQWVWQISALALLGWVWAAQMQGVVAVRNAWERLQQEYAASHDGVVYLNAPRVIIPLDFSSYTHTIPYFRNDKESYYDFWIMEQWMRYENPGKASVRALPELLEGISGKEVRSQVICTAPGRYILLQSKTEPAKFDVEIDHAFMGLERPWFSFTIDSVRPDWIDKYWVGQEFRYDAPCTSVGCISIRQ